MSYPSSNPPHYNDVPEQMLRRDQQPSSVNTGVDPFGDSDVTKAQHAAEDYRQRDYDDDDYDRRSDPYAWQRQQPHSPASPLDNDPYYSRHNTLHDDDYSRDGPYASKSDDTVAVVDGPKYGSALSPSTSDNVIYPKAAPPRGQGFQGLDYSDPYGNSPQVSPIPATSKTPFLSKLWNGDHSKYPLEQKIEAKRRGNLYRQRRPWVTYTLTAAMFAVMIYEFVANWKAQGTPFSFKPVVNPLLGPSQSVLIEVGARFAPCMKHVEDAPPTFMLGCANNTANPATSICTIEDLCEFGGFHGKEPNQWFRFITPIFLHAGLVHIFLNMFVQWTLAGQVEREMGSIPFTLLYFAAGIFGNILGGNFAMVGLPSVGASGAIFGTVGTLWVDLIAHWQYEYRPVKKARPLQSPPSTSTNQRCHTANSTDN
ncbi:hypothetical protein FRC02_002182 [Tulasnella sp. 418]|nr:hypothetical protein FRC02_002182 [Tulasnella sp. 418]